MWLLGGWNPHDKVNFPRICNSEMWSSSDGVAWKLETQANWAPRHTAGYAVLGDRMWVVGGDPIQRHYQNDVWNSADGIHWTKVTDSVPWKNRVLHHTLAFNSKLWVLGGQALPQFASAPEAFYSDVWNSTDGIRWLKVTERAPWAARGMIGGCAVLSGRMWLLGGGTYDTPGQPRRKLFNDVWSSVDGTQWTCHLEHAPWPARQYHEVTVFDNRLWILEGWNHGNRNDVWCSSDGVHWSELPNTPWSPRHAASVAVFDNALWVIAGNNMQSDVWKLVVTEVDAVR